MIDLIGVAIVALNVHNPRMVLLGKRNKEEGFGLWVLPGGKIGTNETPVAAMVREAKEEVDLDLRVGTLTSIHFEYNDEDPLRKYLMLYYCQYVDRSRVQLKAVHEFSELRWFDTYDLPEEMWQSDVNAITRAGQIVESP